MAGVHAGAPGAHSPGVRAKWGVTKSEIQVISYEFRPNWHDFMCPATPQACRGLPLFVLCAVWPLLMLFGQDFRWLMRNKIGSRILSSNTSKETKNVAFSGKPLKI